MRLHELKSIEIITKWFCNKSRSIYSRSIILNNGMIERRYKTIRHGIPENIADDKLERLIGIIRLYFTRNTLYIKSNGKLKVAKRIRYNFHKTQRVNDCSEL